MRTTVATLATLLVAGAVSAGDLKSGPQTGEKVPGPFHPLNVTGEDAGKQACLYCKNGENPVAMVFARSATPETAKLLKKLDEATAKNSKCEMGSFAVFLSSETEQLQGKLKEMADKEGLKKLVLSIDNPAGPSKYNVSKDADVTVVLYLDRVVKANYSFEKGKLSDKDIDAIVQDVAKITQK